jgi:hypothetical protein
MTMPVRRGWRPGIVIRSHANTPLRALNAWFRMALWLLCIHDMITRAVGFGVLSLFASACGGGGSGCPVDTNPATFTGVLSTSVPTNAALSGSSTVTATIENFQPDVEQSNALCDSPQRYCGAQTFPIILGAACHVLVSIDNVTYDSRTCDFVSASASVTASQPCTLDTVGGSLSMTIQSGSITSTMSSIQLTLGGMLADGSGASASLQFQGS